jgi:Predicted RNA-binding protein
MDVSEKWGTDVDTAVDLALADLKCTRDEVNITVLEEPSRGFFGIGSKLALVRVEKKKAEPKPEPVKTAEPSKPVKAEPAAPVQKEAEHKSDRSDNRNDRRDKQPSGDRRPRPARSESQRRPDRRPERRPEREEKAEPRKPVVEREVGELFPVEDNTALAFLREVAEQMGLEVEISGKANDENVYVDIQGKDSGTIIGKRGQTLDAIQYLTSLVVNKGHDDYIRVVVDAENYRAKREKTLEQLANRLADKVIRTRRSVRLEPMNPYERKVIHATLQNNPRVTTRSEGQDPYRRVIIELK